VDASSNQSPEPTLETITDVQEQLIAAIAGLDSDQSRRAEVIGRLRSLRNIVISTLVWIHVKDGFKEEIDLKFVGEPEGPHRQVTNSDAVVYLRELRSIVEGALDLSKEAPRDGLEQAFASDHEVDAQAVKDALFDSRVRRLRQAVDNFRGN